MLDLETSGFHPGKGRAARTVALQSSITRRSESMEKTVQARHCLYLLSHFAGSSDKQQLLGCLSDRYSGGCSRTHGTFVENSSCPRLSARNDFGTRPNCLVKP